jgi:predicted phosphodiesterase
MDGLLELEDMVGKEKVREDVLNSKEYKAMEYLKDKGIDIDYIKGTIEQLEKGNRKVYKDVLPVSKNHVKFGVISDLHIGHKDYRGDILRHAAKYFKKEKIDFIVNAGDTLEGMSGRDGHIYELEAVGAGAQLDLFEKEFKLLADWKVYSIEADGSHGGWFKSKGNMGLDIGKELKLRAPNYIFLGYDEQDLKLKNGLKLRLRHPGGGTAYALSYKMQKYVDSISGGQKPDILIQGHFHKSEYMFYRNIHCFDAATLENQSPFMKKIGTPAHLGYWIIDAYMNKKGVERIKQEFVPFWE